MIVCMASLKPKMPRFSQTSCKESSQPDGWNGTRLYTPGYWATINKFNRHRKPKETKKGAFDNLCTAWIGCQERLDLLVHFKTCQASSWILSTKKLPPPWIDELSHLKALVHWALFMSMGANIHDAKDLPMIHWFALPWMWLQISENRWSYEPGPSVMSSVAGILSTARSTNDIMCIYIYTYIHIIYIHMAVGQNLVPLVNIKIAGKWMFIPLKMVLIGIDS